MSSCLQNCWVVINLLLKSAMRKGCLCFLVLDPGPSPGPGPSLYLQFDNPGSKIVFYGPSLQFVFTGLPPSICFYLFFVLLLKFVIVTVSTYINSESTYMH